MPPGDAGLERQPVDTAAIRQRLSEVGQLMQEYGDTIEVDGEVSLAQAVLRLAKSVPRLVDEIDRLQAQLAVQQAVVRGFIHCAEQRYWPSAERIEEARRVLDAAQAAQPEGEHAG